MVILALIYVAFISLGLPDSLLGSSWPMMHLEFAVPVGSAGMVSMIISGGTIISSLLSHRVIERFGTARVTAASASYDRGGACWFLRSHLDLPGCSSSPSPRSRCRSG